MRRLGKLLLFWLLVLSLISFTLEQMFPIGNVLIDSRDNVTVWCTYNTSESLSFYNGSIELPKENIKVVNETTIALNLIHPDPIKLTVTCKFNGKQGVDYKVIRIATPPVRITDLRCLSYDFNYFECQFKKPQNYDKVEYNMSYYVGLSWYECPSPEPNDDIFICNITGNNYRMVHNNYTFRINAKNKLGERIFDYSIKHFENVIPGKPELKVKNIGTHSVLMHWDVKKTLYSDTGLVYEIKILSQYNNQTWIKLDNSTIKCIRDTNYTYWINGLNPYTWYEVQLRLKVKNATDSPEMWSQTNSTFLTKSTKPDDPPTVDIGSFLPQTTYSASTTEFIIYWKGVPEYKKNGDNFSYIIKEAKKNGKIVDIKPIEGPTFYSAKFVQNEKANYEFKIYSKNAIGISDRGALITVPKKEYPKVILRKIYQEKSYILTWDELDLNNGLTIKDYTIFSCNSTRETSDQCQSDFNFTHVDRETRNFSYPIKNYEKVNFAISANYDDGGSSGMVWAMCTASENFGTVKPRGLPLNGTTIRLDWSLDCAYSTTEGFRFNYCPIAVNATCKEPMRTLNINSRLMNEYYLGGLKPYTTYGIWMSLYSTKKQGPESSTPLEITTLEDAPSPPHGLKVLNVTVHSILLQWEQPKVHNGKLSGYNIYYNNDRKEVNDRNDESIITFNLENLSSYKEYKIYVTANTTLESAPSNDVSNRTSVSTPSTTELGNMPSNKERSKIVITWKRPQVPSGPIDFYEFRTTIFERGDFVEQISRINGTHTQCTIKIEQDKICRDDRNRIEFNIRAVNVVSQTPTTDMDEYYRDASEFKCEEEDIQFIHWYHRHENKKRFLRGAWSTSYVNQCLYMSGGSPILLILFLVSLFAAMIVVIFFLSKKYRKMKDIGIEFPPGLTDLDQESGPKGCENVISRDDITHSDESLCKNESHKLLDNIRVDSGYMNGLDCTEKNVTGEFDDSSIEAMHGGDDSSSSRNAESVEMSDMSDSMTNSPPESPNIDMRNSSLLAPIAPKPQRQFMKPIIINGYVQHESIPSFAEQSIPYRSLDSVEENIISTNLNTNSDINELTKHKDSNNINTGAQENICGYVTHKQLSDFGHRTNNEKSAV